MFIQPSLATSVFGQRTFSLLSYDIRVHVHVCALCIVHVVISICSLCVCVSVYNLTGLLTQGVLKGRRVLLVTWLLKLFEGEVKTRPLMRRYTFIKNFHYIEYDGMFYSFLHSGGCVFFWNAVV